MSHFLGDEDHSLIGCIFQGYCNQGLMFMIPPVDTSLCGLTKILHVSTVLHFFPMLSSISSKSHISSETRRKLFSWKLGRDANYHLGLRECPLSSKTIQTAVAFIILNATHTFCYLPP